MNRRDPSVSNLSVQIVINTPAPALAHAIYRATGVWHRTVPFTPEKILMGMIDPEWKETDHRVKE